MSTRSYPDSSRSLPFAALALAALMVITRFGHFGELSRLPDASWAVFFLGGLLLRDARAFGAAFGLAWAIDLGAAAFGTPLDCFSVAYLFLVPAYGALWWAGRRAGDWLGDERAASALGAASPRATATLAVALLAGVMLCFVVSNLGFWAFGSDFAPLSAAEYASRVMPYLPGYFGVSVVYTTLVMAAHGLAIRLAREGRSAT